MRGKKDRQIKTQTHKDINNCTERERRRERKKEVGKLKRAGG